MQESNGEVHCRGEFLDKSKLSVRRGFRAVMNEASEIVSLLIGPEFPQQYRPRRDNRCDFRYLKKHDVVSCFDWLRIRRQRDLPRIFDETKENRPLHIAFFGDSRVRQQFFSLYQVNLAQPTHTYFM